MSPVEMHQREQAEEKARQRAELRDRFAMAALPAFAAEFLATEDGPGCAWDDYRDLARAVYALADEMLAAREGGR